MLKVKNVSKEYEGSELLLMDEPFKSLDMNLRMEMLTHLSDLCREEKTAVIFVTHDIEEALMIADRILVMKSRTAEIVKEIRLPKRNGIRDIGSEELSTIRAELLRLIQGNVKPEAFAKQEKQ